MLEGRSFKIAKDHKPLTFAFIQKSDKASPRQMRHLDYVSQFSTEIVHMTGPMNITADTLSRINAVSLKADSIDYEAMAQQKQHCNELKALLSSNNTSLSLKEIVLPNMEKPIVCDTSGPNARPFVPASHLCDAIIAKFHNLSHGGKRATANKLNAL